MEESMLTRLVVALIVSLIMIRFVFGKDKHDE